MSCACGQLRGERLWGRVEGGEKKWCAGLEHNSLKRVKIEEKLLWRAYRKSQTLFWRVPSPTPYGLLFPKVGGSQPQPKTAIAIIPGTGKATDCKFGRYIHRVHPNKSPLQILEKREHGRWRFIVTFMQFELFTLRLSKWRSREMLYSRPIMWHFLH